ncbi:basic salivary proline-rich protein 2-like [Hippopotamus amphibius kiboko]|uniref:basic salivary proline-rich protein 2-like n=1 Tax=Hippopotamus amphibius kiboko TaxID=575201 RepID=UPI002595FE44|nr:basic salivary proline-rich protein 2-like [Hippopotamus amphibius kiboko]
MSSYTQRRLHRGCPTKPSPQGVRGRSGVILQRAAGEQGLDQRPEHPDARVFPADRRRPPGAGATAASAARPPQLLGPGRPQPPPCGPRGDRGCSWPHPTPLGPQASRTGGTAGGGAGGQWVPLPAPRPRGPTHSPTAREKHRAPCPAAGFLSPPEPGAPGPQGGGRPCAAGSCGLGQAPGPEVSSFPVSVDSAESKGAARRPGTPRPPPPHGGPSLTPSPTRRPLGDRALGPQRAPSGSPSADPPSPSPAAPHLCVVGRADGAPEPPRRSPPLRCPNLPRAAASADCSQLSGARVRPAARAQNRLCPDLPLGGGSTHGPAEAA